MKLPLTLTCDASAYGISGVLCHIVEGEEKPITFVSRTLSSAEVKYSQTEKEALAIVFATSKLRQYLFGRNFVLKSDHKALTTVFGNKRLLPPLIANRLHRWALELSNFDFDIRYTNKDTMLCADAFSRLPLEEINSREDNIDLVTHDISFLNVTPLDHLIIEEETNKDPVLNKLKEYLLEDPQLAKKDETMKPFLSKLENFSVLQGCIFVDSRAVIPRTCQDQMLKLLHQSHIGINRMKSLARSSVWWPKMDSQIEEFVKECSPCMHHQTAPPAENTPWPRTNQPWQRVHVDQFYFRGDCYLLVVDANSNWIEVFPVRGTTSQENIKLLRECFARTFVNCLNSEFIQKTFGRNECGRRHFQVGDKVLFTRVIQNRRKWFKAQVIRRLGYNVYLVKNLKGTFKVHVNQMRTGSDTKYAEDSDWTLDNAGAGPHRLEQDPQISTSPPPRRSTRPRCPPCRSTPGYIGMRNSCRGEKREEKEYKNEATWCTPTLQAQNRETRKALQVQKESLGLKLKCLESEISFVRGKVSALEQRLSAVETVHPRIPVFQEENNNSGKPVVKVPTFDGQSSWTSFKPQFNEMIQEKLCLDFDSLVNALESRNGEENQQQLHVPFQRAYEIQDFMTQNQFIDAIGDPETQRFSRISSATTLQYTLVQAIKYEAEASRRSYRVLRRVKLDNLEREKGRCWTCGAHDHISTTCPRRLKQRSDTEAVRKILKPPQHLGKTMEDETIILMPYQEGYVFYKVNIVLVVKTDFS
ncbi:K02A2.6-like [Cordylochernes scorpioides]|uniref:RNA-directed DNA polymerase n=1 Tax=Cordylochernes scorpioides TaxID=51811 RepID=A0ABY6K4I1_9ARAC|nr:K02A2.6-like [Cordylochernes scorpioides]